MKRSLLQKPELKYHNSSPQIRKWVLEMTAALDDVHIVGVTVDKARESGLLDEDIDKFCLFMFGRLITGLVQNARPSNQITIVIDDRPFNRNADALFDAEIQRRFMQEYQRLRLASPRVNVLRLDSKNSRGLQVADFIAGAIHRKHEQGDTRDYRIISSVVVSESAPHH